MHVRATFAIQNTLGLHARAAALFVKVANRFRAQVHVRRDQTVVNGKSIMGVLMLAAANGTKIEIVADGPDAAQAVDELGKLIGEKFGEEE
ncbi:MAG: HPr family phosphocarrier protein [Deltaproteobacteria bacterium]|nr:HPr family phosphocarrier protein [Deltaproteobacteria bacterium]